MRRKKMSEFWCMAGKYTIEMVEDRIESLPLVDTAAFDILSLLNNPDSNYGRIVEKLSPDVAVRFLNMANKAQYGRVVRSIAAAVALLGYQKMRQILVTSFLLDHFTKRLGLKDFSFDIFKKQARFCGAISRFLADMIQHKNPEDLFTVSTLSNIGKLIIAVYFAEDHKKIAALQIEDGVAASAAEKMVLGVSHADVSAFALRRFNLPEDICDAVRYHNLNERDIPRDKNFQLEIIARKSAMIVHQFALPDEEHLKNISGQVSDIVADGKLLYREMVAEGSKPEKDQKTYTTLVDQTSGLLIDTLKEVWQQRIHRDSTD
jgi:HD-like signal output (HDOD) protein